MDSLNEEQLTQFFLATLNNRTFWETVSDRFKSIIMNLNNLNVELSQLIPYLWAQIKKFVGL